MNFAVHLSASRERPFKSRSTIPWAPCSSCTRMRRDTRWMTARSNFRSSVLRSELVGVHDLFREERCGFVREPPLDAISDCNRHGICRDFFVCEGLWYVSQSRDVSRVGFIILSIGRTTSGAVRCSRVLGVEMRALLRYLAATRRSRTPVRRSKRQCPGCHLGLR